MFAHGKSLQQLVAFDLTAPKEADKPAWSLQFKGGYHFPVACLSPDGKQVIVQFADDVVERWDGPAGKQLGMPEKLSTYSFQTGGERPPLALSPDGKQLAIVSRTKTGTVGGRIIELETGKEVVSLVAEPTPRLGRIRFSPDGKRLVLSAHGIVRVWDTRTGADVCPLPGHRGAIKSMVVSADGKTVVTAGEDLTVRAWDPETGREKWKTVFSQPVSVTLALPDAVAIESESGGGVAESLVDLTTGKPRALPGAMGEGEKLPPTGFSAGGVAYDSLIARSPDGKSAVTLGGQQTELRIWSWATGKQEKRLPLDVPKDLLAMWTRGRFTPDGKEFHTVTLCRLQNPPLSGAVLPTRLIDRWDATTGKRLNRKEMTDCFPIWTADGSRLFVVRDQGEIQDPFTEKQFGKAAHSNVDPFTVWTLGGMALSPDGKTLAVGGNFLSPGSVRLYAVDSGRLLATLPAGGRRRLEVAFLPDGRIISAGETALVWAADAVEKVNPTEKR